MVTPSTSQEQSPDEMVNILLGKNEVFNKLFTHSDTIQNLAPDEMTSAQRIFTETFPNYHQKNFETFYQTYINHKIFNEMNMDDQAIESNEVCNKLAFDSAKRGYVRTPKVNAYGRGKREKFNAGEFLKIKRENGDYFQLVVGEREPVEDILEELNEDKPRNDQKADVALNRMVEMTAVLNGNCNYKILELHSERRVQ